MAKAGRKATTWIRYSEAKARVGEYLGNATRAESALRKGLEAAQISWQCVRFDTPKGYSGPGPGDSNFWREPDNLEMSTGVARHHRRFRHAHKRYCC